MYPYLNLGSIHVGAFGLLLWVAAVCASVALHKNFVRNGVATDALNVVALVVLAGILGAKAWHELEDPAQLAEAWRLIVLPGWHRPLDVVMDFLTWFQAGFAWYGGLLAAIGTLMGCGVFTKPNGLTGLRGAMRMLDLAAPAAALGYGVGRIGCLTSGDGDYGINTTLPWGVHMMTGPDKYHRALVLPTPATAAVQPTPIYELLFGLLLFWLLWTLASKARPLGWMTGLYLALAGVGRFLVEFVRVNPRLYFHHTLSNAQVASLGSVLFGVALALASRKNPAIEPVPLSPEAREATA
jgi:phosphatidylglycerol:prolipoprotein diacylglycerol transferase